MNELEAITTRLEEKELNTLFELVEMATSGNKQHLVIPADPVPSNIKSLHNLGFVILSEYENFFDIVTLLPPALHRYDHEKRKLLAKKWRIAILRYKDFMAIAAFIISVVLLILRILELAGYKLVFE